MARTAAIHSAFTASPAIAARCATTLAPSTPVAWPANSSNKAGGVTSAPTRRPARPSHLENDSDTTECSGASSRAGWWPLAKSR